MPKTEQSVGKMIDELYEIRTRRIAESKSIDAMKKTETSLTKEIMALLQDQDTTSTSGKLATFSITEKIVPKVVDYNKLKEYIVSTGYVHLLGRTVSAPAAREIWDIDEEIPGVEPLTLDKHSLTRSAK
jgi:hypothetical protein